MTAGLALGAAVGVAVAIGFFLIRRQAWPLSLTLGWITIGVFVVGGAGAAIVGIAAMGKGGEAVTAGMMLLVFGVGVCLVSVFFPAIVSMVQSRRLARPFPAVLRSVMAEPLVVMALIWAYQLQVTNPQQTAITNDWWQKELARRKRIETAKAAIPPKYLETTEQQIQMENWNLEQMAKHGAQVKHSVPPDVQEKLRAYWAASAVPEVIPNRPVQSMNLDRQRGFGYGISLGWLVAALTVPLGLRKQTPSPADVVPPPVISA